MTYRQFSTSPIAINAYKMRNANRLLMFLRLKQKLQEKMVGPRSFHEVGGRDKDIDDLWLRRTFAE